MLDEGDQFVRDMPIAFRSFDFDSITTNQVRITKWGDTKFSIDEVVDRQAFIEENRRVADEGGEPAEAEPYLVRMCALTQDTLTKVPVRKDADGTVRVYSTIGENVFLAAQVNGKWGAGWPGEVTVRNDLFESVEKHFLKVQDYYNEKKLLGIISKKNGRDILALVRLRRDIPDPEFALAWAQSTAWGPGQANFEMGVDGKLAEFYRLGIWRFTRDVKSGKMTLVDRGTFFRTKIRLENETPEMETRNDLWPVVMKDGRLIVGSN